MTRDNPSYYLGFDAGYNTNNDKKSMTKSEIELVDISKNYLGNNAM